MRYSILKPTVWKCRFILDGTPVERRIYEDSDGDEFIRHAGRYYEFQQFFIKKWVTRWNCPLKVHR